MYTPQRGRQTILKITQIPLSLMEYIHTMYTPQRGRQTNFENYANTPLSLMEYIHTYYEQEEGKIFGNLRK